MSNKTSKKTSAGKKSFKQFITARNTRRGATSVGITVMLIAAIVLVNVVLAILSDRSAMYIDVTESRNFKLQSETIDYISGLEKDVDLYVLAKEEDLESNASTNFQFYQQMNRLLHEFEYNSDKIKLHYVDLVKNPTFLSAYPNVNRTETHMILATCGENYTTIDPSDIFGYDTETSKNEGYMVIKNQYVEQSVTSAILKVTKDYRITVSVLSGQDEGDVSAFTSELALNAYDIETVDLEKKNLSADSQFVIIYKPSSDISDAVYKKLSAWLVNDEKYGHNILYFPGDDNNTSAYPNLNKLLADYGMEVQYGYICENDTDYLIDSSYHFTSAFRYADTAFTEGLSTTSRPVVMGAVMPIRILDTAKAVAILTSSDDVEFENLSTDTREKVDPPLVGAAVGRKGGSTSGLTSTVTVIGSSDAVTENYLRRKQSFNNDYYFINLVNILSQKGDVDIIIAGKDPTSTELGITSINNVSFLSAAVRFILPGLVLAAGLIVWIRRRHQ